MSPRTEFSEGVQAAFGKPPSWIPSWVSPLENDDRAEYRDDGFLDQIGLERLKADLRQFWPRGGPQWDGLATVPGGVMLVEAKAHFAELGSSCAAGTASAKMIREALEATKRWAGAPSDADWMHGFYQYANRLAHLKFLRDQGVDAYLVFLYFVGDKDMPRYPATQADWHSALDEAYAHLGLKALPSGVGSVFLDVNTLSGVV